MIGSVLVEGGREFVKRIDALKRSSNDSCCLVLGRHGHDKKELKIRELARDDQQKNGCDDILAVIRPCFSVQVPGKQLKCRDARLFGRERRPL